MADTSSPAVESDGPALTAAALRRWLEAGDGAALRQALASHHPADGAELARQFEPEERARLLEHLHPETLSGILSYLDSASRDEVVEALEIGVLAAAVAELDTDDAVALVQDLDEKDKEELLAVLPSPDRQVLEEALTYPEESAGRLMQRDLVATPGHWSVGQVLDHIHTSRALPDHFYEVFVVDSRHKLLGAVPLARLMRARRTAELCEIMSTDLQVLPLTAEQDEVAFRFRKYGLVSLPVVDGTGRLDGVITVDDVVSLIDAEADEDILHLGGVSIGTDYSRSAWEVLKPRFIWLLVNLATAILAAWVIAQFETTIQSIVILAALAPIVASMGGNAGLQTLTIVVRAMATRHLQQSGVRRVVMKECLVGLGNGLLFAGITGLFTGVWVQDASIGVVMGISMLATLLVANLAGVLIPVTLDRLKADPAVASSIFLTTVTDVIGFFVFLGLASWMLL